MLRYVGFLVEIGLTVYCLIDCIQTDQYRVRNLAKSVWVLLIVLVPVIGAVAWLVAGRPEREPRAHVPWPSTQTAGFPEYERPRASADVDREFLAAMRESDEKHEQMLRDWERSLREREARLGDDVSAPDQDPQAPPQR